MIDKKRKQEIDARLLKSGYNGLGLTDLKYAKLDAVDKAVSVMIERRKTAQKVFNENELTGANIEREINRLGGEAVTDQTLNKAELYRNFIRTYEDVDVLSEVRERLGRISKKLVELEREVNMLHIRDAECQEIKIENEILRNRNRELEADKKDMEYKLSKQMKKGKAGTRIELQQIEIPETPEGLGS